VIFPRAISAGGIGGIPTFTEWSMAGAYASPSPSKSAVDDQPCTEELPSGLADEGVKSDMKSGAQVELISKY
tara:strand:+ start:260 stop:475 length:216 start_codon:yes stop_codon:yes gene_type:complete